MISISLACRRRAAFFLFADSASRVAFGVAPAGKGGLSGIDEVASAHEVAQAPENQRGGTGSCGRPDVADLVYVEKPKPGSTEEDSLYSAVEHQGRAGVDHHGRAVRLEVPVLRREVSGAKVVSDGVVLELGQEVADKTLRIHTFFILKVSLLAQLVVVCWYHVSSGGTTWDTRRETFIHKIVVYWAARDVMGEQAEKFFVSSAGGSIRCTMSPDRSFLPMVCDISSKWYRVTLDKVSSGV